MIIKFDLLWEDRNCFCFIANKGTDSEHAYIEYKMNIQSRESRQCLSWFEHDVFKKLTVIEYDTDSKRFILDDKDLYDMNKLNSLKNIDDLAFFNKTEYSRITGNNIGQGFSGLFK